MPPDLEPLADALRYAAQGWPVLPCHAPTRSGCSCAIGGCSSPGKHPRLSNGLTGASTDRFAIERWWHRWPTANVAIRTGEPSGLVVIDVDRRAGGDRTLAALVEQHGVLPATLAVRTGDGVHLYFAHPGQLVRNDAGQRIGPGVDVRADGGYVLAPPSLHHNGRRYETIDRSVPVASMPPWLQQLVLPAPPVRSDDRRLQIVRDGTAWARAALDNETASVRHAVAGERNATLNRSAFSLGQIVAGGGLDHHTVQEALLHAAQAAGLGEREASATIGSGLRAGAQHPRTPPGLERDTGPPRAGASPPSSRNAVMFVPWPKDFDGPGFSARSDYVERCWTSVLGPTAVLALRAITHELEVADGPTAIDLEELGRSLGIGSSSSKNSILQRTLARLEGFNAAVALPDGSMAIRQELPPLRTNQLRRAGPVVQHWHQQLCPDLAPTRTLSR